MQLLFIHKYLPRTHSVLAAVGDRKKTLSLITGNSHCEPRKTQIEKHFLVVFFPPTEHSAGGMSADKAKMNLS